MPFYDDENIVTSYTTDFGNGATLTIKLKSNFDSAEYVRQFLARSRAAINVDAKITSLEEKQKAAPVQDFDKIQKEIEQLQERPDLLQVMSDVIFMTGESWDRYKTKEDEANNNPVPFTKENIAGMKLKVLDRITKSLTDAMGVTGGDADPKAPLKESESPSFSITAIQ